ncbi:UPF0606 protein KIAA1549 isoform X1 [Hypomesus transpacificus]|uniref:UPF0606 protein KIAA1549 isoform X1 n=1 Tax=Hypomesus transpacificus TaxID=137520 RepID=UPI001F085CCC|nr:UPF0606 protein KIAA1549 isoform X1 [Hypomesus transpacificus]
MESFILSKGWVVTPQTWSNSRCLVLELTVLVTLISAGTSFAAADGPSLGPAILKDFLEGSSSWTESPLALPVPHTKASEKSVHTTTTAVLPLLGDAGVSQDRLPPSQDSSSGDSLPLSPVPLSSPPLHPSQAAEGSVQPWGGLARLARDVKLTGYGSNSTLPPSTTNPVPTPDQQLLHAKFSNSSNPTQSLSTNFGTLSPHRPVPLSDQSTADQRPPSNQHDQSDHVSPLAPPSLPTDESSSVYLDPRPSMEPSSRLLDLTQHSPSRESMMQQDSAQGTHLLLEPPVRRLDPSFLPLLNPQTISSTSLVEPTLVPPDDFFPTSTMEVDWGSGDYPEPMSLLPGDHDSDSYSMVTTLPSDMFDLDDSEDTESYDTSFPSRVGVSPSSRHHLLISPSLTTAYSSSMRSAPPTALHPLSSSIPPSPQPSLTSSHPRLEPTANPQSEESSGVDWSDAFTVEPTDVLLPDMNSLEYVTTQMTKDNSSSAEHRGNVTTSKISSLVSISSTHILATSTLPVDPSHLPTASYNGTAEGADNSTWVEEGASSDPTGLEPYDTAITDPPGVTVTPRSGNVSVVLLEPSVAPTPSMNHSIWDEGVPSGDWSSLVTPTPSVDLEISSLVQSVVPSVTQPSDDVTSSSSLTDILWYVSSTVSETIMPTSTPVLSSSMAFSPSSVDMFQNITSAPTELSHNTTSVPPVTAVMADQGMTTFDGLVPAWTNDSLTTVDVTTATTSSPVPTTEAATTVAMTTQTSTTATEASSTPTSTAKTTPPRPYLCEVTKPEFLVRVGFPSGATVGYAKLQVRDILKSRFNRSLELQVVEPPPRFVFRAVSGPVVYSAISVINALRQSGRRFLSLAPNWPTPDRQYQVHSVLQFVPSHIDVRVCNFSQRIEKGLTMAYAKVRRLAQESTNFTVQVVNITLGPSPLAQARQQREQVDITFAVSDANGYVQGSEVSNLLRKLNMVEFSYYLGFPVLQIAEPVHYPELNTTLLLRSSWVRTVLLGVLEQGVEERAFQVKMERRLAQILEEVLGSARRTRRATSGGNNSVQMVRTARLVGPDQPLEMVYFVEGPSGERLPAVTTATMLNSLDVQRAAIVLGYRVQGILAQPVDKVASPPSDNENTNLWIVIGVVVPLIVVTVIISILYWKLCRTDKLEFQPDAMTSVQQRQKVEGKALDHPPRLPPPLQQLQTPSVKGFDFAKLHLGQHSKDDLMVIQEPGPPPLSSKEAASPQGGEVPAPRSKNSSSFQTKVSRSARRRGRISPSDGDSVVSDRSSERDSTEDNRRGVASPSDGRHTRKVPINVLNGPPPLNGHANEQLSSASIFEHVDRMSRPPDGTRRPTNKIQLIAMQPMPLPPLQGPMTNGKVPDRNVMNKEIQVALRHKSEIEHHRNKIRLRAKRKGHYDFPVMEDAAGGPDQEQDRLYHKAQQQIDKILDPDIHIPSFFTEHSKSGRGKRSPKQRKKLNGGLSDADKDRLISNDSDGTYRKHPGVSNVAYVLDPDQVPEPRSPSPLDDVFLGSTTSPPGHAPPLPPYMPPQPTIEEARQQMHSLLDDAFALVSPTSQGSPSGITLPGGGLCTNPPSSSPPARGPRPWPPSYPGLGPYSGRYADLGLSPPSVQGLLHRQGLGSGYLPPGDAAGPGEGLQPDSLYTSRAMHPDDLPSSARPRPVGGSAGAQLHHLTQVGLSSRINGYAGGSRPPPGQNGGTGWNPYEEDFPRLGPSRDATSRSAPSAPPGQPDPPGLGYPPSSAAEHSSPPNHSSASLIKAIREELLRLSQKQAAVSSYHS